jgi:hypothetical protein
VFTIAGLAFILAPAMLSSRTVRIGGVAITVTIPIRPHTFLALQASRTIPPQLSILGRDERLALYDKALVAYVSLGVTASGRRTGPARFAIRLPYVPAKGDTYYAAYRGPHDDAWTAPASTPGREVAPQVLIIETDRLPKNLNDGSTYHFAIYHTIRGIDVARSKKAAQFFPN